MPNAGAGSFKHIPKMFFPNEQNTKHKRTHTHSKTAALLGKKEETKEALSPQHGVSLLLTFGGDSLHVNCARGVGCLYDLYHVSF